MANRKFRTVKFENPIKVADGEGITEIELRQPLAGDMRGLRLGDILEFEMDPVITLVLRLSKLTERQMLNLEPLNLAPIANELGGFFMDDKEVSPKK